MQVFPTRFTESLKPIKWLVLERSRLSKPRPDITGAIVDSYGGPRLGDSFGVFSVNATQGPEYGTKVEKFNYGNVQFSAKKVNALFGKSSTTQASSLRLLAIIKA